MLTVCVASRLYFTFGAHNDTDDVQIKQMEELITNYGPIMYWWFGELHAPALLRGRRIIRPPHPCVAIPG
jgi:hypothetical protein